MGKEGKNANTALETSPKASLTTIYVTLPATIFLAPTTIFLTPYNSAGVAADHAYRPRVFIDYQLKKSEATREAQQNDLKLFSRFLASCFFFFY